MEVSRTILICVCVSLSASLPTKNNDESTQPINFASKLSQLIAVNQLKSNIDIDGNQVHSPLGVSSILATLAEGAAGETYEEFNKVLGYPKERNELRDTYKRILGRYQNQAFTTEPSFQTWLYIYRNYTAREEYKQVLRDYYFVQVRDINRYDNYDTDTLSTTLDLETTTISNSKDVIGFETLKSIRSNSLLNTNVETTTLKLDEHDEEFYSTKPSKFDYHVVDEQYVEKPTILAGIQKENEKQKNQEQQQQISNDKETITNDKEEISDVSTIENFEKKLALEELKEKVEILVEAEKKLESEQVFDINKREDDLNFEDNETVNLAEKLSKNKNAKDITEVIAPIPQTAPSHEPEKLSLPLQKLESAVEKASQGAGEIMIALESHLSSVRSEFGARSLFYKDDITSSLSANSLTGRELNSKTKMLLFNGLYYRGNWAIPFSEIRKTDSFFFMTKEDGMEIPMMVARGSFHFVEASHLNAKIICLPYENKKYAMMLMIPNDIEGINYLIEKLQPEDLSYIKANGKETNLEIILPKFQIDETSRSKSMLQSLGLNSLFSREKADLSLMIEDNDVHVDEIVQFVTVHVDEGGSSANALSAINPQSRNNLSNLQEIEVNRPFLYFIMDCEENFVLASGKVYSPEIKEDLPIAVDVEVELE